MTVSGLTISNSAAHSIELAGAYKPDHPDDLVSWVKVFTWRANGDGLGSSGNVVVEDCFVRTQAQSTTAQKHSDTNIGQLGHRRFENYGKTIRDISPADYKRVVSYSRRFNLL